MDWNGLKGKLLLTPFVAAHEEKRQVCRKKVSTILKPKAEAHPFFL